MSCGEIDVIACILSSALLSLCVTVHLGTSDPENPYRNGHQSLITSVRQSWFLAAKCVFVCIPSCTALHVLQKKIYKLQNWTRDSAARPLIESCSVCEICQFYISRYVQCSTENVWLQRCVACTNLLQLLSLTYEIQISTWSVAGSHRQGGRAHTLTSQHTHAHAKKNNQTFMYTQTHMQSAVHILSHQLNRRENGVGRGERDWVGGSGRKRWRKRQRESGSEWHMAFSLKKDEQHETKTRIWIS